jgi:hypothetical protein
VSPDAGALARRAAVLAIVAVALWNPRVPTGRAPVEVMALIDDSLSIDRDAMDVRWTELVRALENAPAQSRLTLWRFATDASIEIDGLELGARPLSTTEGPPRARPLDRTGTDIESALAAAASRVHGGEAVIVLVTDGVATA